MTFAGAFLSSKGLPFVSTWQIPCWGHAVSQKLGGPRARNWPLATSGQRSSVSRHPFPCKSHACSCRWGHLGLQVARRRGFTGLKAALQFAGFFGLAGRLRLFGAMPIPSHIHPSPCALALFAVASSYQHKTCGCSMPLACAFRSPQNHRAKATLAR